jgi:hypothetical protein
MRHLCFSSVSFALIFILLAAGGCNNSNSPPPPLGVEQLPSALDKAFSQAKPEVKDLASQIVSSLQARDYTKAYQDFQSLSGTPGLTREQSSVATRGMLTVNGLLQSAEAKGDEKAATTLENYRRTK